MTSHWRISKYFKPGVAWFEPFVYRDETGRVKFENRVPSGALFRDRWDPVFRREPRRRRKVLRTWPEEKKCREIIRASNVAAARGWEPAHPMLRSVWRVENALREARRK